MLFHSLDFVLFLPIVFLLYWLVFQKNTSLQNGFLLLSSYVFYGWWDWRFLSLIAFSTLVDYSVGIQLGKSENLKSRKILLLLSILVNLSLLGFFKYFNFFYGELVQAFSTIGLNLDGFPMKIILPVGISFYTFQSLSYTIDIYRNKISPTRDFVAFAAFISFFPQLVAGPIERATHFLPQFFTPRKFEYAKAMDGMRQILWGLFKKVVIADNCAVFVNDIFEHSGTYPASTLLLGAVFFAFQIYGDFSGYSDIAIGLARLFGFNLRQNFAFPYFSRNVAEFWRRWHISLTSWFRDYVYIPMGGSRVNKVKTVINVAVVFLVSGIWHGANWTFIAWGAINTLLYLPVLLLNNNRKYLSASAQSQLSPTFSEVFKMLGTFLTISLTWVLFRSETLEGALLYYEKLFSWSLFEIPYFFNGKASFPVIVLIVLMMFIEWFGKHQQYALETIGNRWPLGLRIAFYYAIVFCLFWFGGEEQQFIYFQF
jgi:D-alanyl-lipoteichoic acid acyltransferase DltB (MBOAT superfamily)